MTETAKPRRSRRTTVSARNESGAPAPRPIEFTLLEVRPTGFGLDGHVLRMRYPSVRFLIAKRRGEANDLDHWEEILDAIREHDLDREPDRLTAGQVNAIGLAWLATMKERAVPPESGKD